MAERPDPNARPAEEPDAGKEPADEGEAYSEDEEAEVAARLEDLGYI
ncbi:MAG: hypothetical protein ABJB93_09415 [Gaiellales bacterium]